jgi:hypothetical protein
MTKKTVEQHRDLRIRDFEGRLEAVLSYIEYLIHEYGPDARLGIRFREDGLHYDAPDAPLGIKVTDDGITLYYDVLETDAQYEQRVRKEKVMS